MNKLLFDESPLIVLPSLAKAIGLHEAILLQQLHYWLNNEKSGRVIDGVKWIYNTLGDWEAQLQCISPATISRAMHTLEEAGLIQIGNFNRVGFDRTQWYTINYDKMDLLHALIEQEQDLARQAKLQAAEQAQTNPEPPAAPPPILQNEKSDVAKCKMQTRKMQNANAQNAKSILQNETTIPENSTENSTRDNAENLGSDFEKTKADVRDIIQAIYTVSGGQDWQFLDPLVETIPKEVLLRTAHNLRANDRYFNVKQFEKSARINAVRFGRVP